MSYDDFGIRTHYPIKWWQLWRYNHDFEIYTFRYKWLRDLYDKYKKIIRET